MVLPAKARRAQTPVPDQVLKPRAKKIDESPVTMLAIAPAWF
jgi:hypothetical protein